MRLLAPVLALAAVCLARGYRAPPLVLTLVLAHANVVDVETGAVARDQTIVIRDRRIVQVRAPGDGTVDSPAQVVDVRGSYVIPGLWDAHVHMPSVSLFSPALAMMGVTYVRIMAGFLYQAREWQDAVGEGRITGPRAWLTGPILDGEKSWPFSIVLHDAAEARRVVDSLAELHVDFIKTYTRIPRDAFFAVADEARRRGLRVAGHVPVLVGIDSALDAGMWSIEHCSPLLTEVSDGAGQIDETRARTVARSFVRHGTYFVPTLAVHRATALDADSVLADSGRFYVPREFAEGWRTFAAGRTADDVAKSQAAYRACERLVAIFHEEHVAIVAGTDIGNRNLYPGFSLHDELWNLRSAGLTALEALQAATIRPARMLGVADSIGRIANGMIGSLVILDANPLDDIRNTRHVRGVVIEGRYYDQRARDSVLAAARGVILKP